MKLDVIRADNFGDKGKVKKF